MTFVIVMMIVMNLTIVNSKRLDVNNKTFIMLQENIETFKKEAILIEELKCYLINGQEILDFPYASVIYRGDYYLVEYEDLCFRIKVNDGLIIDLSYE